MLKPDVACLREFKKFGPRQAIHMENPLETAYVGPKFGWGQVSGNHQSGLNSVSQVDVVSDMVPTCKFCESVGGEGSEKEQWPLPTLLPGRKLPPPQLSP